MSVKLRVRKRNNQRGATMMETGVTISLVAILALGATEAMGFKVGQEVCFLNYAVSHDIDDPKGHPKVVYLCTGNFLDDSELGGGKAK